MDRNKLKFATNDGCSEVSKQPKTFGKNFPEFFVRLKVLKLIRKRFGKFFKILVKALEKVTTLKLIKNSKNLKKLPNGH
jgi:hypothetical protein